MCIAFMLYYPVKKLPDVGLEWNCVYGFDLGTGCITELEQADLSGVEDLGRSFGTKSEECVSGTPSTASSTSKSHPCIMNILFFRFVNRRLTNCFSLTTESPSASTTATPPPTVGTPASGTSWLGATSIAPIVTALFMMMMMML